jgi:hypothetical protein
VEPSRAARAGYLVACVAGILLSTAIFVQPTITLAADDNAVVTASGPVVLRGTRPVSPTPAPSPKAVSERNPAPAPYMGFVPYPVSGSGWDTGYSTNGLSYTPGVTQ